MDAPNYEELKKLVESEIIKQGMIARLAQGAIRTGDWSKVNDYLSNNPEILRRAEKKIFLEDMAKQENPFFPFPSSDELTEIGGDVGLGLVNFEQGVFRVPHDFLTMHAMVLGRPGSGKTHFNRRIAEQVSGMNGVNVVLPDSKRDYRGLINKGFKVIVFDKFRFNPLQVPSWAHPLTFINLWAQVFSAEFFVGLPGIELLSQAINELYVERDVFLGSKNFPTMKDLLAKVGAMSQRKYLGPKYRDIFAALDVRLKSFVQRPEVFSFSQGIDHEIFLSENIVLEMPDAMFSNFTRNFVTSLLINLAYARNMGLGLRGNKLRTLFMVDEGATWMGANREGFGADYIEPAINEIVRKAREFGIGLWVSSQESKSFNQVYRSNCLLKVGFPLTDGEDVSMIQRSFGLDDDQKDFLSKIPMRGWAVIRYGGFERPFLLEVPAV